MLKGNPRTYIINILFAGCLAVVFSIVPQYMVHDVSIDTVRAAHCEEVAEKPEIIETCKKLHKDKAPCKKRNAFLAFPVWYRNLDCDDGGTGAPVFTGLNDIWTVITNVLDILIQVGGLAAIGFIIYGGIRYIVSQGEPENLQSAKKIITNAIIGLVLAIMASTIVGFIAGSF